MITQFSKLHDLIVKEASNAGNIKRRTVTKTAFVDSLKLQAERYSNLIGSLSSLNDEYKAKLADKIYSKKNDPKCKACIMYATIAGQTKSVADTKIAFSSILDGLKSAENVIANFMANVDIIFEGGDDVTIHSAKLSHLAAAGFLEKAEMYVMFALNLFSIVTYEVIENSGTKELDAPLPYRYKFLDKNLDDFIKFHTELQNGGNRVYLEAFKGLKKSMDDIKVANPERGSNIAMLGDGKMSMFSRNLFGGFSLNIFKMLGEVFMIKKHKRIVELAAEKEDLIAHVALLQMDLGNLDPNSAEYQKLVKVINNYNRMIADMTKEIEDYYSED